MKRIVFLIIILYVSNIQAQTSFVGGGATLAIELVGGEGFGLSYVPFLHFQGGGEIGENLVLRGALETNILLNLLAVDIIYRPPNITPSLHWYAGGGGDVGVFIIPEMGVLPLFGAHGLVGLETRLNPSLALYGELQPAWFLVAGAGIRVRTGVNYYF